MVIICLLLIPVSFAISVSLCALLIRLGQRWGHLDEPGAQGHKRHEQAVPASGGIAIVAAVVIPVVVFLMAVWLAPALGWGGWPRPLAEHIPGIRGQIWIAVGILLAMLVLHVMGVIDDRRGLAALPKLSVQLAIGALLVCIFEIRIFQFLDVLGPMGRFAIVVVSILWLVGITNAMNMLDNMDGLAAGVGTIIAGLYLGATLIGGQWFVAAMCALLMGALLGFLCFNLAPAKLFMGDGGSLVLGFLLAVISVRTTYIEMPMAEAPGAWYGVLMPVVVMAVPLYDMASVILLRLRAGLSPLMADGRHLSHRLVQRGLSRRAAVVVIWLTTLASGLGGVMLSRLAGWQAALVAIQVLAILAALATLELSGAA